MLQHDNVAPVLGINRHRIGSDGEGVTTLVAFYGCPLDCKFCLNSECHNAASNMMSPHQLYDAVKKDDIYFRATGGGITFGGGEPLLYPRFINEFAKMCKGKWTINIETSLNIPLDNLRICVDDISCFIIDLKCFTDSKYILYTGISNHAVLKNIEWLTDKISSDRITVRVPTIPGFTDDNDTAQALRYLDVLGIKNIDQFTYILPDNINTTKAQGIRHGKRICTILKDIRSKIAKDNGLIYKPHECTYKGPCSGTCPYCEAELGTITEYINILEQHHTSTQL